MLDRASTDQSAALGGDRLGERLPGSLRGALEAAAQVAVRRWAAADPPVPLDGLPGGAGGRVNEEEFKVPAGPRD